MVKKYSAFLLRCWHLGAEGQRIKIEHIPSGAGVQLDSLADALAWIGAHLDEAADGPATRPALPHPPDEEMP